MIPHTAHQIWIGGEMPKQYREWCDRIGKMNPGWEHRIHGEELVDKYEHDPYVKWMLGMNERTAFVVDRLRVLLLRDEGGVYLDTDCYPVRPLSLLNSVWDDARIEFVAGMRSPDRPHVSIRMPGVSLLDNTVLASAKNSRISQRLCDLYRPDARKHTGFSMGMEILRNAGPDTCLLGYRYFYAEEDTPHTIVLHDSNNAYSWGKPNGPL